MKPVIPPVISPVCAPVLRGQYVPRSGGGSIPANAITTDSGDPITLDDGTTYVTTDA